MRKHLQVVALAAAAMVGGLFVHPAYGQSGDMKKMTHQEMMDKMSKMSASDKADMLDKMTEKDKMMAMKMAGHNMSKMSPSERMDMMGKMSMQDKADAFDKMPMNKKMAMMSGKQSGMMSHDSKKMDK